MKFLLKGCLQGCLLPLGVFWGVFVLIILSLRLYSAVFGDGAKNKSWIESNRLLAVESAALCRDVEKDRLMGDKYSWLRNSENHRLRPSSFESIRFYDLDSGDDAPVRVQLLLSYAGKNNELSLEGDYSLALYWFRQYTYTGDNPPLFFDPHYDFEVICLISKNPLKVAGFADRMTGQ